MRDNLTEMVFLIDESGSMGSLTNDTIGGFNSLLNKQKLETGYANVTTILFNNLSKVVHNSLDIREVKEMTTRDYRPSGGTALLDAFGLAIEKMVAKIVKTPETDRASKVIFVVITDGEENSSHKYKKETIKLLVEMLTGLVNWQFMFLGANVDAFSEAYSLGISSTNVSAYTASTIGTKSAYEAVGQTLTSYRSCGSIPDAWNSEIK